MQSAPNAANDNVLQFPRTSRHLRTITLTNLDGQPLAKATFPCGEVGRVWMWIEDQIRDHVGPCDVGVADDDVITADGFPVARVVF